MYMEVKISPKSLENKFFLKKFGKPHSFQCKPWY